MVTGYTVTVPALPGCVTQGQSRKEALERAKEAIQAHLAGLAGDGIPIPEERNRSALGTVEVLA
ncbi:MAG: type II toxin-antitoxin system HicB family antitoxin [SAR202 cluster bacterium]|nr:type II toxin-antitoxin system HicB family antitoxin [SAR202 cluster bacterium]